MLCRHSQKTEKIQTIFMPQNWFVSGRKYRQLQFERTFLIKKKFPGHKGFDMILTANNMYQPVTTSRYPLKSLIWRKEERFRILPFEDYYELKNNSCENNSIPFHSIPFHSIPFFCITFPSQICNWFQNSTHLFALFFFFWLGLSRALYLFMLAINDNRSYVWV